MRIVCCLCVLLTACASHAVRCDGRLQPINPPAGAVPGGAATAPAGAVPGGAATAPAGALGPATPRSVP